MNCLGLLPEEHWPGFAVGTCFSFGRMLGGEPPPDALALNLELLCLNEISGLHPVEVRTGRKH